MNLVSSKILYVYFGIHHTSDNGSKVVLLGALSNKLIHFCQVISYLDLFLSYEDF